MSEFRIFCIGSIMGGFLATVAQWLGYEGSVVAAIFLGGISAVAFYGKKEAEQ